MASTPSRPKKPAKSKKVTVDMLRDQTSLYFTYQPTSSVPLELIMAWLENYAGCLADWQAGGGSLSEITGMAECVAGNYQTFLRQFEGAWPDWAAPHLAPAYRRIVIEGRSDVVLTGGAEKKAARQAEQARQAAMARRAEFLDNMLATWAKLPPTPRGMRLELPSPEVSQAIGLLRLQEVAPQPSQGAAPQPSQESPLPSQDPGATGKPRPVMDTSVGKVTKRKLENEEVSPAKRAVIGACDRCARQQKPDCVLFAGKNKCEKCAKGRKGCTKDGVPYATLFDGRSYTRVKIGAALPPVVGSGAATVAAPFVAIGEPGNSGRQSPSPPAPAETAVTGKPVSKRPTDKLPAQARPLNGSSPSDDCAAQVAHQPGSLSIPTPCVCDLGSALLGLEVDDGDGTRLAPHVRLDVWASRVERDWLKGRSDVMANVLQELEDEEARLIWMC